MVSIGYDNSTGYFHLCGGTLIDNMHVLTSAHCFDSSIPSNAKLSLVMGTLNYSNLNANSRIDRSIKNISIHEKYNKGNLTIVILDLPARFDIRYLLCYAIAHTDDTPMVEIPSGRNLPTYGNFFLQPILIKATLNRKLTQLWKLFCWGTSFHQWGIICI